MNLTKIVSPTRFFLVAILVLIVNSSCRTKKHLPTAAITNVNVDTTNTKCKLEHKSAKALTNHLKNNAFNYEWIYAKANAEVKIDSEETSLDIRVRGKKDSAILISIQYVLGIEVARVLITKDSVKMTIPPRKQYFRGDFNYINELLNADLDFEVIQALLFGNYADFDDDDKKLKSVTDRQNCRYLLSTERKRKLRRIAAGQLELKKSLQTMTLNPDNFRIIKNEFIDVETNRTFTAIYNKFVAADSVYAPHLVNIDILAEKKVNLKIEYVRIEKNTPQKLSINISPKYDPIPVKRSK